MEYGTFSPLAHLRHKKLFVSCKRNILAFLITIVSLFLVGCSEESPKLPKYDDTKSAQTLSKIEHSDMGLYDKLKLSQNPLDYATDANESKQYDFLDSETVKKKLFMVWDSDFKASVSESLWVLDIIKKSGYKENLLTYSDEERARFASDIYTAPAIDFLGIIGRNTDIRAFPTKKPYFYDPKKAGEGYPFDNFQSSRIYINTPVKIVSISSDGAFYYVASSVTDGWVDSRDVIIITKEESEFLRDSDLLMSVKDKVSIGDANGRFVERMQVGSFVYEQDDEVYSVANGKISKVTVDKKAFVKFPLMYSQTIFAHLTNELMNEPYGWGGGLDDRDCSMFLRDLFLPFGLWICRI